MASNQLSSASRMTMTCLCLWLILTSFVRIVTSSGLSDFVRRSGTPETVLQQLKNIPARETQAIKAGELKEHIVRQAGGQTDVDKPSVGFMINVFEHLLEGEEMPMILGHTDRRTKDQILHSDTIRSYTATRGNEDSFVFHVPVLPNHEHIRMVELRFLDNERSRSRRQRLTLHVQKNGDTFVKQKIYFTSKTKSVPISFAGLSLFNQFKGNVSVKIGLRKSFRKKSQSVPILVVYSTDRGFLKSALKSASKTDINNLLVEESDKLLQQNRFKRASISNNSPNKNNRRRKKGRFRNRSPTEKCQAFDFKVDFDLIGWGPWIVHPKTYNARVCYGSCPSPIGSEYTPTNHAMLQSLMLLKRPRAAPEPCCVPTKLRPLSMLYFEYDDIVVRHHQDMVVDTCGCR